MKEQRNGVRVIFMNIPLATADGIYQKEEISLEEAQKSCKSAAELFSVVGHSGTAELISSLLDVDCQVNRIQYNQSPGEIGIVLKLNARMPEGSGNLDIEMIKKIGFKWFKFVRLS